MIQEGSLGRPEAYVLPTNSVRKTEPHPLLLLAKKSRERAAERGFDSQAAIGLDSNRFLNPGKPAWGLSQDTLPQVLVVARNMEPLSLTAEKFIGIPKYPLTIPRALDIGWFLNPPGALYDKGVVTYSGETVQAWMLTTIYPQLLDLDKPSTETQKSDLQVLKEHLNPRRMIEPPRPELFSWRSSFNSAKDLWPGVINIDQIKELTPPQQADIVNKFLGFGLEAIAGESDNKFVRLAAHRLINMCDGGQVQLHLTEQPKLALTNLVGDTASLEQMLPAEHSLAFLPGTKQNQSRLSTLLTPLQWVELAMQREIVALTHLVRVASFARDSYWGKLSGSDFMGSRELGAFAEYSRYDGALARANGLALAFLNEANNFDNRIYGIQINRDAYCQEIERTVRNFGNYDDPPEPKGFGGNNGPDRGPDDDLTLVPSRGPKHSLLA